LSDALLLRGREVLHIDSKGPGRSHRLTEFARNLEGRPVYPGLL
jgi:hypothetical protein